MSFLISERIRDLPDYPFVAIMANVRKLQSQGKKVIRLDMGSPDLPPPMAVREVIAKSVLQDNKHGYTGYRGIPEFREAVARYYKKLFDVDLNPETEILPLLGSKEGLVNMTMAVLSPGETVLVPSLAYPTYASAARLAQGEVQTFSLRAENNFLPPLDEIPEDIAQKARILWVDYPNNPTGALATLDDYAKIAGFCKKHDILLASDNPYFAMTFDGKFAPSALQVPGAKEYTVEFMSLSKSHNMAGWRLGACVGKAEVIAALLTVKSNMDSGHFRPIYEAGIEALDNTPDTWTQERNATLKKRRDMIVEAAPRIGLTVNHVPEGALYIWASVNDGDDKTYAREALEIAGVSIVPGFTYGEDGKGYVRISLTATQEVVAEALQNLEKWYTERN